MMISKPHKIYSDNIEAEALAQFESAMEQDFSIRGALMPDAHTGYSLPIGGVVAADGVVIPAWVGYDIGCGMLAAPLGVGSDEIRAKAKEIATSIYEAVPTGFSNNAKQTESELDKGVLSQLALEAFDVRGGFAALGSLGGGNHFIEIGDAGSHDEAWVVIHSGSRGPGWKVAQAYMTLASGGMRAMEGHFALREDSDAGVEYINDMDWFLQFALANRMEMLRRVCACVGVAVPGEVINRNHNHAVKRDGLWIHRKGATHAELGMRGVIPGNMRDGSFVVVGKGNPESLWSSSHGAGRVLGRAQAKREITLDAFAQALEGIEARVCVDTIDEAPMAYKDIFRVMREQEDLVDVVCHISPILNIKG